MKRAFLVAWLLLPAAAAAYHWGPGQDRMRSDAASDAFARAREEARAAQACDADGPMAREHWAAAEVAYGEAIAALPPGSEAESRALRLERAKAAMQCGKLPEARVELAGLVEQLQGDPSADAVQLADARRSLASAQYYMTWLLRLEGAPRTEWEPEVEASRQNFKLVAEQAERRGDTLLASVAKEDLESSIRLARMELKDLQGLPLPSQ
ncbi:MAG: hypothetical protein EPO68_11805 [Planctomycetota bacterium]|nr:MAG: hypothetical protein EPO68_11805 [Planctomycetota bacterium]